MWFCFVCISTVSCAPNIAHVSGLSIFDCPFGFSLEYIYTDETLFNSSTWPLISIFWVSVCWTHILDFVFLFGLIVFHACEELEILYLLVNSLLNMCNNKHGLSWPWLHSIWKIVVAVIVQCLILPATTPLLPL